MPLASLALILYLGITLGIFSSGKSLHTSVLGMGGDSFTAIWCLQWWPWAITHGLNPFISHKVWYPEGIDLTWVTSVPAFALLGWPITALAGPIVTYNVFALLSPTLSAWAVFLLVRDLGGAVVAALIGGYLYGFSPYMAAHLQGHLNMAAAFMPPVLLLVSLRRLRGALSRRACVAWLTVCFVLQFGVSLELLCTSCLFGGLALCVAAVTGPIARPALRALAVDLVSALALTGVIVSPFLVYLILGIKHLPKVLNSPAIFSADPLGFILPGIEQHFGHCYFLAQTARFSGNSTEQTAYLGPLLILLLAWLFTRRIDRPVMRLALLMLVAIVACSLGPVLWVNGVRTGIVLPWAPLTRVPLIRSALPVRFTLYMFLLVSLCLGAWLSEPGRPPVRLARLLVALCICVTFWPERSLTASWVSAATPTFFTADPPVMEGRAVLILPFGPFSLGTVWQARARFSFAQAGGYTGLTPPTEVADPTFGMLGQMDAPPGYASRLLSWCQARGVSVIIAGPGTSTAQIAALRSIGWTQRTGGGVTVFSQPPAQPRT